jgi:ATP-binding cassette subfamily C protein
VKGTGGGAQGTPGGGAQGMPGGGAGSGPDNGTGRQSGGGAEGMGGTGGKPARGAGGSAGGGAGSRPGGDAGTRPGGDAGTLPQARPRKARAVRRIGPPLLSALRRRRGAIRGLAVWSVVEVIPIVVSGRAVALAVDDGFQAARPEIGFAWLGLLGAAVLAGALATRQIYLRTAEVVEPFRDELIRMVVEGVLRRGTTAGHDPGAAGIARLTRQVEVVRDSFAGMIMIVRSFVFTVAGAMLGLFSLTPVTLVFIVPPFAAGLAVFLASLRGLSARQRRLTLADEDVAESVGELTGGLRDIIAVGGEDRAATSAGARIEAQAAAVRSLARMTTVRTLSVAVGGWLPVVLILAGAPWLVARGASAGTILGTLTYIVYALQPALQMLVQALGASGLQLVVNLERILETGAAESPAGGIGGSTGTPETGAAGGTATAATPDSPGAARDAAGAGMRTARDASDVATRTGPGPASDAPAGRGLRLEGVTFAYGPHAEPVINALDLAVPEGDHLAVIGPSGIGKSTLALIMAGMLVPRSGSVQLGGVPVSALDVGYRVLIPQEAYVFPGSLAENLTYLRPDAAQADLTAAAAAIGLAPLIERLGGFRAEVAPAELSAGERQLIALTRAYLSPAPLVILDEASCHLDPAAESRAEHAFAARPCTLVVVAHRMSSAIRARRILVMDGAEGRCGTHRELLDGSQLYRDLVGHWQQPTPASGTAGADPPAAAGRAWSQATDGTFTASRTRRRS